MGDLANYITADPGQANYDVGFFEYPTTLINLKFWKRYPPIQTLKPATFLNFHRALVKRKYQQLYSNKTKKRPGRKNPDRTLIDLVIEMKKRNPTFGYGRLSGSIFQAFGVKISRFSVGRILRKNKDKLPTGDGPSWLSFIGHMKDSLWSVDLFRCESITLKSHWIMVILDQFTRRVIGFAVHAGDCDGIAYCQLFNEIDQ